MSLTPAIYDLLSKKKLKYQVFNTSDANFIAPADVFFVTASGGGGGGAATLIGGASGAACEMVPYYTTKGTVVPITIGAGGTVAGAGGTTTIGTQISLPGGRPGNTVGFAFGGLVEKINYALSQDFYAAMGFNAKTIGNYITGASTYYITATYYGSGNSRYLTGNLGTYVQGAGGYFGPGGNGVDAAANTGAGGGINSAGGSGKAIIFWEGE